MVSTLKNFKTQTAASTFWNEWKNKWIYDIISRIPLLELRCLWPGYANKTDNFLSTCFFSPKVAGFCEFLLEQNNAHTLSLLWTVFHISNYRQWKMENVNKHT